MPKHIVDLLTTLGVPAEDAVKIDALPEAEQAAFDAAPYTEKIKTNFKTQFENDPAFFSDATLEKLPADIKKKLESGQYARATNITKAALAKSLGFTTEEIKDLEAEDFKTLDAYVPALAEKWQKTKTGDKQLQADLIAERKKNEEITKKYGPEYETGIETKYQSQAEQKITAAIFNAALIGELSAIPGLKIPAGDIAATANTILQGKYGFERVGDYSVELRQKANPAMKVLKNGSSQELTLKDALLEIATERKWIEEEKKDDGKGGGKFKVEPNGKGELTMIPPHLQDKISNKIKAEA